MADAPDGMTDLERLVATAAIERLKARRDLAVDTKDWATYESLHVPEHRSHNEGFAAWNSAAEMIANVREIMADVVSVHHSHTPLLTFESPTEASGIWGMEDNIFWTQAGEEHWLKGYGFYHERYVKRDGAWLFCFRQLKRIRVDTSEGALFGAERAAANRQGEAR